jgi:hypothetical protein
MLTNLCSCLKKLFSIVEVNGIPGILKGLCGFYWYRFVGRQLMSVTTFFFACKSEQNV